MRKRKKECDMRQIKEACFPVFRSSLWRVGSIRSEKGPDPSQSSVARSWYYKSFFLSLSVYVASSSSFPCISFDAIWLSHAMFAQRDENKADTRTFRNDCREDIGPLRRTKAKLSMREWEGGREERGKSNNKTLFFPSIQ